MANFKTFTCEECGCVAARTFLRKDLCPDCLSKAMVEVAHANDIVEPDAVNEFVEDLTVLDDFDKD